MKIESKKTTRKVVVARTVMLVALVAAALAFTLAVNADREEGDLLDEEGVIAADDLGFNND